MPYKNIEELPEKVKSAIPDKKGKELFMEVVNNQLNAGKSDTIAFTSAWAGLKNAGYNQGEEGQWVKKRQIDVISDIPNSVRAKIPSKEGKKIWLNAYNDSQSMGMANDMCETRAWQALTNAGYNADEDGEWMNYNVVATAQSQEERYTGYDLDYKTNPAEVLNVFEKFMRVFASPKEQSEANEGLSREIDAQAKEIQGKSDEGEDELNAILDDLVKEQKEFKKAEYQGKQVELDKPFRTPNESKKFAVYVKDGDGVKIVRFGDPDMEIKRDDPDARASFRARHSCDTKTDKTTPGYWSCKLWSTESVSDLTKTQDFCLDVKVFKLDDEKRLIYGWASVIEEGGKILVDKQGDTIEIDDLVEAAHDYMIESREAKEMHEGKKRGETVESIVFTKDLQKALGIDLGKIGWFIVQKINDDETWDKFKSGELKMLSIGGKAVRQKT